MSSSQIPETDIGRGDVLRPSWMSQNLGAKLSSQKPRVEQLEQLEPPIQADDLEQQEPPDVPTTDEERTVVELSLIHI